MKVLRARDYEMTVTAVEDLGPNFRRFRMHCPDLLRDHPSHPTQWVRGWFPTESGKLQQRAYTLINADPASESFDIEFVLHDGPAERWARAASVGDVLPCTVMGSKFQAPVPAPAEYVFFGDAVSIPAINSVLDAIGDAPARVWLEWQKDDERDIAVHTDNVTWIERQPAGAGLVAAAKALAAGDKAPHADAYWWIAAEFAPTRAIKKIAGQAGAGKSRLHAMAYWR